MTLILYNTLSRREEPFTPLIPGIVSMYCCGITVYDYCHLGHARTCVVWDVVRRYLEYLGYKVRYIQNSLILTIKFSIGLKMNIPPWQPWPRDLSRPTLRIWQN